MSKAQPQTYLALANMLKATLGSKLMSDEKLGRLSVILPRCNLQARAGNNTG